jgi:hypothetical protein
MTSAIRQHLIWQGFACDSDPRIAGAAVWLRFTPALSTLFIVTGTALRSPAILWSFAAIAALGAAGWHLFDHLFNAAVRRWVGAAPLPPNPPPRRFAMAVAAGWSALAGLLMAWGLDWAGVAAGGLLALAGLTVATTHFCVGSWLYGVLWRRQGVPSRHRTPRGRIV